MIKLEITKSAVVKGTWNMKVDDGEMNTYNMSKEDILWCISNEMDNEEIDNA